MNDQQMIEHLQAEVARLQAHNQELQAQVSCQDEQDAVRVFRTGQDITERKRTDFDDITERKRREQQNEERQTFLLSLSDAVRHLQNPLDIQNTAMKLLAEKLDVEQTGYYMLDDDEDSFTVTARYDRSTIPLPERGRLSTFDPTLIDEYHSGSVVTLCDSEKLESESLKEAYRKVAIRSWAVVPLVKEGRLITAIGIQCAIARQWTDTELQILKDVAERTWEAVERAKAEEALKKNEEKYRTLFNSMDEGFLIHEVIWDESGRAIDYRLLEINPAHTRMTGLPRETVGKLGSEFMPDVEDYWLDIFGRVARTGVPERAERYNEPTDRWYNVQVSRVAGHDSHIAIVFDDTTERKQREQRQEFLLQLSATLRTETGTKSLTVEQTCQHALAVLAEHPAGIPFALLYLLTDDGHQARLVGTAGIEQQAFSGPKQLLFAQQEEATPGPLAQVNRTRQALLVEDLHPLLGDASLLVEEQPLQSAYVLPITHPTQAHLAGLLVMGIIPYRAFDDGYREFFHLIANQIATAIVNAHAHEEAQARAEHLAALDRAKTSFFNNISHEFRTPLTLLLGPLEDLLGASPASGTLSGVVREQLTLAHRNALRLLKLVNTLLDFSRIEAGRTQASYVPTDLAALTRDIASMFRSAIERAGLRLRVDCPALPEPVYVDTEMWEKVVLNLLSNAFKFTFEGEIVVSLRCSDTQVELEIRDTGMGIPTDELPHLFERFHRVQGTRARTYEGSGIGLALVEDLVRLHGGSVSATSMVGQGSSFTVRIPTGSAHLPTEQVRMGASSLGALQTRVTYVKEVLSWLSVTDIPSETSEEPSPSSLQRAHGEGTGEREESASAAHILLAEDNVDMREYLAFLLNNAGYTVEAVGDGSAALIALGKRLPDLLLSDVMMPELDGLHLLRQVRADPHMQRLPVILLSARAGEEAAIEGLTLGTDDYLMKPFSARELLARVRTNVELGRMREQAVRDARQHIARLEGLYEALLAVHSTLSPEYVLELISHEARTLLGAEYALTSFTSDQEQAQVLMSVSASLSETAPFTPQPFPATSIQEYAHHQRTLKIQHDPQRERYASLQQHHTGSPYVLEAPLLQRDGSEMGMVQVVKTTEGTFNEEDRLVLLQLMQMTSIALEHGRLFQQEQDELLRQKEQEAFISQFLAFLAQELHASLSAFTQGRGQFQRVHHLLTLLEEFSFLQDEHQTFSSAEESDLVQVARQLLKDQQALFPDTLLTIHVETEPFLVRCDQRRVRFVLSALLNYALAYPLSRETIQVRVQEDVSHGTALVALHYQTARSEESEHLFEFSYWSRQASTSQNLELGVSLSLSAAIIKRHGGRIWSEQQETYHHLCFVLPRMLKEEVRIAL